MLLNGSSGVSARILADSEIDFFDKLVFDKQTCNLYNFYNNI